MPMVQYKAGKNASPWDKAMESLGNEIKLRHYSPKTLKSYSLWAQKLKAHTNQKQPDTLEPGDVKDFLTWLAVKKKVSPLPRTRRLMG